MKELHHGVHCAPEAHALSRCQRRLHPPIEGLHEPPRRRLQEGNDIMMPPSPDPSGSRVSPGARCGEEQSEPWRRLQGGRRRPRASPSPAKAGISPGLTPTPKSCSTEQMDATKCTPPPRGLPQTSPEQRKAPTTAHQDTIGDRKVGSGPPLPGRLPAPPRCPAADDAGTTAPGAATGTAEVHSNWRQAPPRLPTAAARPSARPGLDGPSVPEAATAAAGAPPSRGGRASPDGASPRSSPAPATPRCRTAVEDRATAAKVDAPPPREGEGPRRRRRRQGFARQVLRRRRRRRGRRRGGRKPAALGATRVA
jgi:hypothetical protein